MGTVVGTMRTVAFTTEAAVGTIVFNAAALPAVPRA